MSKPGAAMGREAQMKAGVLATQRIFLIRGLSMGMSPLKKGGMLANIRFSEASN